MESVVRLNAPLKLNAIEIGRSDVPRKLRTCQKTCTVSRCDIAQRFLSTDCFRDPFSTVIVRRFMSSLRAFRLFFPFLLFVSASTSVLTPPFLCAEARALC